MKNKEKYLGCLIGGAVGDALGYTVEFMKDSEIFNRFGETGITDYVLNKGVAQVSDDTQMTLFTANGLLLGKTENKDLKKLDNYLDWVFECYKEWLQTQMGNYPKICYKKKSWLMNVKKLYASREPGFTCLKALRTGRGSIKNPLNSSKGCGGVMRVAPIGLFFNEDEYSIEEIVIFGAEAAAITHGHDLGYISSGALVHIINLITQKNFSILEAVEDMLKVVSEIFNDEAHINEFTELMCKAISLSKSDIEDLSAIKSLGEGWVAEETLAIGIYCSLKYSDDFEKAIVTSVNHSGDSDSTGAVTGNIIGAYLGIRAIPEKFLSNLELKDVITEIAEDLYIASGNCDSSFYNDNKWQEKYVSETFKIY